MANEPVQGLPYPDLTGVPPNVPADIKALADSVAPRSVMRFASIAARDAALPAPVDGMVCFVEADKTYYARVGGAWIVLWRAATSLMVQRGNVVVAAGETSGSAAVEFPVAFPGTPTVLTDVAASTAWNSNPSSQTASGFQANVFRITGSGAGNVSVNWIAVYQAASYSSWKRIWSLDAQGHGVALATTLEPQDPLPADPRVIPITGL